MKIKENYRWNFINKRFIDNYIAPEKVKYKVDNAKLKSNIIEQNIFSIGLIILKEINNLSENEIIIFNRKEIKK